VSRAVLGLGVALVTVAGCVWYLPALADLRAGPDRPPARRTAARACVVGWGTAGAVGLLLCTPVGWPLLCAPAVAGAGATAALRIRAILQHRHEAREAARHWATLDPGPPRHDRSHGAGRYAVAAIVSTGLIAAAATTVLLVAAAPQNGPVRLLAVLAPVLITTVFLAVAVGVAYGRREVADL